MKFTSLAPPGHHGPNVGSFVQEETLRSMLFAADARQLSNFPKVGREAGMKPLKKWKRHCKSYDKIQRIPG